MTENLEKLVSELVKLPTETEWLEFKHNDANPEDIGGYISALSNSATMHERDCGYVVWGIDDTTHGIVGTNFNHRRAKIGNEELENWLHLHLSDNANFEFHEISIEDKKLVVLVIGKALYQSVKFKKEEYVRVGSYKKKLKDYPALAVKLWNRITHAKYEQMLAKTDVDEDSLSSLLDFEAYFEMLKLPLPQETEKILHYLTQDRIISAQDNGLYAITNLGATVFSRKMCVFSEVERKRVRVVKYEGQTRTGAIENNKTIEEGYAVGFKSLLQDINGMIPPREEIIDGLREPVRKYPELAIRELIANALIHQDFAVSGAGPLIEIFDNRIEITNPGAPLIDIRRFIDSPPRSRNELTASLLRRMGVCEELGTGWDKIALHCEQLYLPAPKIEAHENSTKIILFSYIPYKKISLQERLWTCYIHACVKYALDGAQMNNSSLRERFGLDETSSSDISKLIKRAVSDGYIKPFDPQTAPKYMRYIPAWA